VVDIVPTILEVTRIPAPESVDGIYQKPIEGVSLAYTFDKDNASEGSRHHTQYFEMFGIRALYHDGWIASTVPYRAPWEGTKPTPKDVVNGVTWELFDLTKDWTQNHNLATSYPAKLRELQDMFWVEAEKYQVLPLDASGLERLISPKPSIVAGRTEFVYSRPIVGIPQGTAPSILNRSFTITAEVEVPAGGGEGMLATTGGRFGGWGFYLLKGKPIFVYDLLDLNRERIEGGQPLSAGKHAVAIDFKYEGPGLGKGGTAVIQVDGTEVVRQNFPHTLPFVFEASETFDVGSDTGTGVDDGDYRPPFPFTGKLNKLTIRLGPSGLSPADWQAVKDSAIKRD